MTVTLHPSQQRLASVDTRYKATDSKRLLETSCEDAVSKLQSSFAACSSNNVPTVQAFAVTDLSESSISPVIHLNGLVNTAVLAYSSHHHLVMRPDDVWVTILSQFNLYVNANAEKFRHLFVDHELVIDLDVHSEGTFRYIHFGRVAEQMGKLMHENVKDPEMRKWIIPDFSTTTEIDVVVSSIVMHKTHQMTATLETYFSYELSLLCGLPAVTLLGVKADWENLLVKTEKLSSYGDETAQWHSLLKPVLAAFVRSFDEPDSDRTKDFWQRIAHQTGGGSGPSWLSGWITAFCFFDNEGEPPGEPLYWDVTVGKAHIMGEELPCFELDGVGYHRVDTTKVPPAYAGVKVYGEKSETVIMVVGLVGMEITSSGVRVEDHQGKDDMVQPVAGWWMVENQK